MPTQLYHALIRLLALLAMCTGGLAQSQSFDEIWRQANALSIEQIRQAWQFFEQGATQTSRGEQALAIESLQRGLEIQPAELPSRLLLAYLLEAQGQPQQALAQWRVAQTLAEHGSDKAKIQQAVARLLGPSLALHERDALDVARERRARPLKLRQLEYKKMVDKAASIGRQDLLNSAWRATQDEALVEVKQRLHDFISEARAAYIHQFADFNPLHMHHNARCNQQAQLWRCRIVFTHYSFAPYASAYESLPSPHEDASAEVRAMATNQFQDWQLSESSITNQQRFQRAKKPN